METIRIIQKVAPRIYSWIMTPQIGTSPAFSLQNPHLSSNCAAFTFENPPAATTNSPPVIQLSGTPGSLELVNLCIFGSPVVKKEAKEPVKPS